MAARWRDLFVQRMVLLPPTHAQRWPLATTNDAADVMRAFVGTYYALGRTSVDMFTFVHDESRNGTRPVYLDVDGGQCALQRQAIHEHDWGLLADADALRTCLQTAEDVSMEATFRGFEMTFARFCLRWTLMLTMSFQGNGASQATIRARRSHCRRQGAHEAGDWQFLSHLTVPLVVLNVLIVALATSSTVLSAKKALTTSESRVRRLLRAVGALGDLSCATGAALTLAVDTDVLRDVASRSNIHLLIGTGAMLSWFRMVRYLGVLGGSDTTALVRILMISLPEIAKILASSIPVMVGFALAGMSLFAYSAARFATFGMAMQSIFAMANGDYVREAFDDTSLAEHRVVSRVYIVMLIAVATWVVLNMVLAQIQTAFFDEVPPQDLLSCRSRVELYRQRRERLSPVHRRWQKAATSPRRFEMQTVQAQAAKAEVLLGAVRSTAMTMCADWASAYLPTLRRPGHDMRAWPCTEPACDFCNGVRRMQLEIKRFMSQARRVFHSGRARPHDIVPAGVLSTRSRAP
ncbi:hypothetical protein PBRA_004415 [Plasmodiophora brassicae]|nr:hypothetical protein PBRA_004415 [Plasmodiophora brassicae]